MGLVGGLVKAIVMHIVLLAIVAFVGGLVFLRHLKQPDIESSGGATAGVVIMPLPLLPSSLPPVEPVGVPQPSEMAAYMPCVYDGKPGGYRSARVSNTRDCCVALSVCLLPHLHRVWIALQVPVHLYFLVARFRIGLDAHGAAVACQPVVMARLLGTD